MELTLHIQREKKILPLVLECFNHVYLDNAGVERSLDMEVESQMVPA